MDSYFNFYTINQAYANFSDHTYDMSTSTDSLYIAVTERLNKRREHNFRWEFWSFPGGEDSSRRHPEDGGRMDIRNVGILSKHITASQPTRTRHVHDFHRPSRFENRGLAAGHKRAVSRYLLH